MSRGPMGKGQYHGPVRKPDGKTLKRVLSYIWKYKLRVLTVVLCIVVSAIVEVASSLFLQTLIDDYILPLTEMANPVFTGLLKAVLVMGVLYIIGIIATFAFNFIMVGVAQGVLKDIRDEMFVRMQKLPVKYFDTHTHGDVMSCYTNDTDTLRQMITQSIPQIFSTIITIVTVFVAMVTTSVYMTIFVLVTVFLMMLLAKQITSRSGKYFVKQQQNLGKVNGFIEEMMNGQKVVQVFCREEENKRRFKELNDELCESADKAHTFTNVLGPINAQLGNVSYVVCAIAGGALALGGVGGFTLGGLASFLTFKFPHFAFGYKPIEFSHDSCIRGIYSCLAVIPAKINNSFLLFI